MPRTDVLFVRHADVHNPDNVFYARLSRFHLSEQGFKDAEVTAQALAEEPLAAIYSSPMLRARRTARVVLDVQPEVDRLRIDSDLHEVRTAWEGEPLEALERIDWDFYNHPRQPEDESLHAIHGRMRRWLQRTLRRHTGTDVLAVSHGDPILILVGALAGLPLDPRHIFPRPYIQTGTLYRLQFDAAGACQDVQLRVPHAEEAA